MRRKNGVASNALKGAVAGAVATWVLDLVTTHMYQREGGQEREREDRARAGRSAYESAAERLGQLLGRELSKEERRRLGVVIHWLLGIGAGVAYAVHGRNVPAFRRAGGGGFGTAFWAAVDEGMGARGLAGHLAYGVAAEQTLRVLDAVA